MELLKNITSIIISSVVQGILKFIFGSGLILAVFVRFYRMQNFFYYLSYILLSISCIMFFIIYLIKKINYTIIEMNGDLFKSEMIDKTINHTIIQDDEGGQSINSITTIKIKAKTNLNYYSYKHFWSGKPEDLTSYKILRVFRDKNSEKKVEKELKIINVSKKYIWTHYQAELEPSVKKGEVYELKIIYSTVEKKIISKPFVSTKISMPTKKLSISVNNKNIKMVKKTIGLELDLEHTVEDEIAFADDNGAIKWEVTNPKLMHTYAIDWSNDGIQ